MDFERKAWRDFDGLLLVPVAGLAVIGLVVLASATQLSPGDPSTWGFVARQLLWWIGSAVVALVLAFVDYHLFRRWTRWLYGLNLALLLAVRLFGEERLGAQRWLSVGPVDLQPSEFAKVLLILTLADVLARSEDGRPSWGAFGSAAAHVAVPMFLVMLQPDMGTSLVFVAILLGMLYVAGFPGATLALLASGGLAAVVGWVAAHLRWGVPLPLRPYQLERLLVFLNPRRDPLGSGYHVLQSMMAIGSGGLTGQGLFAGGQNKLNYLPEQHTDFIFAVLAEEWGFVGGAFALLCFFFLLVRVASHIPLARDVYGSLVVAGVAALIGFHVLVNVGMTMSIMPVTGVPLPFLSYGGSSLLSNGAALGLVLSVGVHRRKIRF